MKQKLVKTLKGENTKMNKHKKRTAYAGKQKSSSIIHINKTLAFFKVFVNSDEFKITSVICVLFLILMRIAVLTGRLIALVNV